MCTEQHTRTTKHTHTQQHLLSHLEAQLSKHLTLPVPISLIAEGDVRKMEWEEETEKSFKKEKRVKDILFPWLSIS